MASEVIEIDTKGGCLLCLGVCQNHGNLADGRSSTAFKMLLRFLNFDTAKLGQLSSSFTSFIYEDGEGVDISVSLCASCSLMTTNFLKVFQEFERIQSELGQCVRDVHQTIEGGERNKDGSRGAHCNSSLVEVVRKETMEKCVIKMTSINPASNQTKNEEVAQSSTTENEFHVKEEHEFFVDESDDGRQLAEELPEDLKAMDQIILNPKIEVHVQDEVGDSAYDLLVYEQDPLEMSNDPLLDTGNGEDLETQQSLVQQRRTSARLTNQQPSGSLNETSSDSDSNSTVTCDYCQKSTFRHSSEVRVHQIKAHTFQFFFHRLPPGTTEFQLKAAIDSVLSKKVVVKRGLDKRRGIMKCPCCTRTFRDDLLRPHILHMHFERVVKILDKNNVPPPPHKNKRKREATEDEAEAMDNKPSAPTFQSNPSCSTLPGGKLQCDLCGKIFTAKENFERHVRELHSGVVFQCAHCERSFPRLVNYRIHLATVHTSLTFADRLPPNCSDEEIREAVKLLISKKRKAEAPTKCPLCSKNCRDCFQMRSHILRSHFDEVAAAVETIRENDKTDEKEDDEDDFEFTGNNPDDDLVEVTECKVELHEIEEVEQVENMEVDDLLGTVAGTWMPPHSNNCKTCDICGKGFRTTSSKSQHRKSHNEVLSCVVCQATFRYENSFIRHCQNFGHSV